MKNYFAILLTLLALSGCATLEGANDVTTTDAQESASLQTQTNGSSTTQAPTVPSILELLQVLDAGLCDFTGVEITENTARKGSRSVVVGCK